MFSRFRQWFLYGLGILLLTAVLTPQLASAGPYGRGAYSSCSYQACAANAPSSTQATLPSGLKISVNLVDGQTVPKSGYKIVVTPLNGQGSTFKQVDFYINGTLVQGGVQPDQTGTASWQWDPTLFPGTIVKVVVTDSNGGTITQEFTIKIGEKAALPAVVAPTTEQPSGLSGILQHVSNGTKEVIRALPRPVVYSFPYILFILLGANAVLLLVQARRELSEYRTLQALLARMRTMSEGKKTFLELVSHYLRTPLTVVAGGIEMLQRRELVASSMVDLKSINDRLHNKIELLIGQINTTTQAVAVSGDLSAGTPVWRQPGLFLPVVLIGVAAFTFTYLTTRAGSFTISQVNIIAQVIIFFILALTTYQVFRRIQLRKRDAVLLQQVVAQEEAVAKTRDVLITNTAVALNEDLRSLDSVMAAASDTTQATKFIRTGQTRFHDLMSKFTLVSSLRGGHSTKPFVPVRLKDVLEQAQARIKPKLVARGIAVTSSTGDVTFPAQDGALISFIVQGVLDNAVSYSPDNGSIEVEVQPEPSGTTLTVTDHGAGIPSERQSLLFQPFSKTEDAETFNHEGIGLSLYIDKLIVTYLGGAIDLQSKPGRTTVTLHLPVSQA